MGPPAGPELRGRGRHPPAVWPRVARCRPHVMGVPWAHRDQCPPRTSLISSLHPSPPGSVSPASCPHCPLHALHTALVEVSTHPGGLSRALYARGAHRPRVTVTSTLPPSAPASAPPERSPRGPFSLAPSFSLMHPLADSGRLRLPGNKGGRTTSSHLRAPPRASLTVASSLPDPVRRPGCPREDTGRPGQLTADVLSKPVPRKPADLQVTG